MSAQGMTAVDERISGAMVKSHLEALRVRVGEARYAALVSSLSRDDQEELALVTPLSWVRIAALDRLYHVLAEELGTTVEVLHTEIAGAVVGAAITTLWRALLRFAGDEALVSRSPTIFKKAYQQGRLEVASFSPGASELVIFEWPEISEFALRGFRVGVESMLRASAFREPRATVRRTPDGAVIRLTWHAR